ncbi:MAG: hypothetical protein L6Q57_07000 [Alphaproteobacteria bacterium]|nr:hypothetical protein [Alphaproteobacteria bacterium]
MMKEFETSLLREKFTIRDLGAPQNKPLIALSNRMAFTFHFNRAERPPETLVVRAHNMHLCIRATARLLAIAEQFGPLIPRSTHINWQELWDVLVNDYEYAYNPMRWLAIYHEGKVVYAHGNRHPFLDMVEKFQVGNEGTYEDGVTTAEDAFRKSGKDVKIDYEGHVALVVNMEPASIRLGHILRGSDRKTTFNVSIAPGAKSVLNFSRCLSVSAAFLEGIQLTFFIGSAQEKIRQGIIRRQSKEEKQLRDAQQRLGRLISEITQLEEDYKLRYRPEKPDFAHLIVDAEDLTRKILTPGEQ